MDLKNNKKSQLILIKKCENDIEKYRSEMIESKNIFEAKKKKWKEEVNNLKKYRTDLQQIKDNTKKKKEPENLQ